LARLVDWEKLRRRAFTWLLFGVVFSLAPLVWVYYLLLDSGQPHGIYEVLASGELVVVSAVLGAGAIGELFAAERTKEFFYVPLVNLFVVLAILFFGGMLYAHTSDKHDWPQSAAEQSGTTPPRDDPKRTAIMSLLAFGGTLFVGASSIWVNSLEKGVGRGSLADGDGGVGPEGAGPSTTRDDE
jgi:hypothetical protein